MEVQFCLYPTARRNSPSVSARDLQQRCVTNRRPSEQEKPSAIRATLLPKETLLTGRKREKMVQTGFQTGCSTSCPVAPAARVAPSPGDLWHLPPQEPAVVTPGDTGSSAQTAPAAARAHKHDLETSTNRSSRVVYAAAPSASRTCHRGFPADGPLQTWQEKIFPFCAPSATN